MYARRWRDTDRLKRPAFFRADMEWKGREEQPLQGRHIVVYAEQGLGDVIQFIRYVPLMQQDGATVSAVVQPELEALVEHSLPGVRCLTGAWNARADHHVALLDLPLHYGTTLANVPAQVALPHRAAGQGRAVARAARAVAGQVQGGPGVVGLAAAGEQQQPCDAPVGPHAASSRLPGVQCFSLQKGDAGPFTDVVSPGGAAGGPHGRVGRLHRQRRDAAEPRPGHQRRYRRGASGRGDGPAHMAACWHPTPTGAGCWSATIRRGIRRCGCSGAATARRGRCRSGGCWTR